MRDVETDTAKDAAWPWMTATLVLALSIVYFRHFGLSEPTTGQLIELGARRLSPFGLDDWWRFGASLFLHASLGHLVGNLAVFGLWGYLFERRSGPWLTLLTFLAAGLWGGVLSSLYHDRGLGVGASGATLAFVTWAFLDSLLRPEHPPWDGRAKAWSLLSLTALLLSFRVLGESGAGRLDVFAHLGGAMYGALIGVLARTPYSRWEKRIVAVLAWGTLLGFGPFYILLG